MKLWLGVSCAALMAATNAAATSVQSLKFDNLVQTADGVVVGTVGDIEVRKDRDGVIYRYVTLVDLEIVTGSYDGAEITLRFEGGALENEVLEVHGSPDFVDGERVVLFVDGNGQQIVPVVGWEQGVFRVENGAKGGNAHLTDAVGNRVFGIRNDKVMKEKRFEPEIELVGPTGLEAVTSEPAGAGFGVTELGDEAASATPRRGQGIAMKATLGEPMSLSAFLAAVREEEADRPATTAKRGPSLVSVTPDEVTPGAAADAARGKAAAPDEPLEQSPGRGRLPRRILPPDMDQPDLE